MNFNLKDIIVDFNPTFGNNFILVDIVPKAVYRDNKRTDEVIYSYDICCVDRKMRHLNVKIPGKQLLPKPEDGKFTRVDLVEPVASPYILDGQLGFTINVNSIKEIK